MSDCPECAAREESFTNTTRVITAISFTCNGTVMYWRAAGEFSIRPAQFAIRNSVLSIWRERSSGSGIYDRVGRIELGICGGKDPAPLVTGMSSVYECYLPQSDWVTVESRDIVGIELVTYT